MSVTHKIVEYLAERDVWIRPKTAFETEPCYMCQLFDPWLNITDDGNYGYKHEQHPCWERRNYCHSFDRLCKHYKEAGKTFWSSERWRIENREDYGFMHTKMFENYDSSSTTVIDKDAKAREVRENIIKRDYEILKALGDDNE